MCPCEGSIFRTFQHQFLTFFKRVFSEKVKFEANKETKMIVGDPGPGKILKIYIL